LKTVWRERAPYRENVSVLVSVCTLRDIGTAEPIRLTAREAVDDVVEFMRSDLLSSTQCVVKYINTEYSKVFV